MRGRKVHLLFLDLCLPSSASVLFLHPFYASLQSNKLFTRVYDRRGRKRERERKKIRTESKKKKKGQLLRFFLSLSLFYGCLLFTKICVSDEEEGRDEKRRNLLCLWDAFSDQRLKETVFWTKAFEGRKREGKAWGGRRWRATKISERNSPRRRRRQWRNFSSVRDEKQERSREDRLLNPFSSHYFFYSECILLSLCWSSCYPLSRPPSSSTRVTSFCREGGDERPFPQLFGQRERRSRNDQSPATNEMTDERRERDGEKREEARELPSMMK